MNPTLEQQRAIDSDHPRILCIAGPGGGKTGTAAKRVLRLIEQGCDPQDIAIIAYTNSAAKEFESRLISDSSGGVESRHAETDSTGTKARVVEIASGSDAPPARITNLGYCGTLHAFCLKHINEFGGYDRAVTVLDDEEADEELLRAASESGCKAKPGELKKCRKNWMEERNLSTTPVRIAVGKYYRMMMQSASLDYNSILMVAADLLTDLGKERRRWEHLLVDEYQDAARIDAHIYHYTSAANRFFVGDPDQNCFSFRGSDITNILHLARSDEWEKHYLELNFRCAPVICEAAQRLIEHSVNRIDKRTVAPEPTPNADQKPHSDLKDSRGELHTFSFNDENSEARSICGFMEARKETHDMNEHAVLVRTNRVADRIRDELIASGIETKAKSKPEPPADWRLARAALHLLTNPKSQSVIEKYIRLDFPTIAEKMITGVKKSQGMLDMSRNITGDADKMELELSMLHVSEESISRIKARFDELPETADLNDLLVALTIEPFKEEQLGSGVTVSTIHGFKGKEADTVIIAGCEDEIIPDDKKSVDLQEERRVFFVAMTRARKELIITHAMARRQVWGQQRMVEAKPSRFLKEAGIL